MVKWYHIGIPVAITTGLVYLYYETVWKPWNAKVLAQMEIMKTTGPPCPENPRFDGWWADLKMYATQTVYPREWAYKTVGGTVYVWAYPDKQGQPIEPVAKEAAKRLLAQTPNYPYNHTY